MQRIPYNYLEWGALIWFQNLTDVLLKTKYSTLAVMRFLSVYTRNNQSINHLEFIKYLLNSHHRLITVLRIGCTKINGKQFLFSRSSPHSNNKEQGSKCCKRATEAHENQEKNHKNDDRDESWRMGRFFVQQYTWYVLEISRYSTWLEGKYRKEIELIKKNQAGKSKKTLDFKKLECYDKFGLWSPGNEETYKNFKL